MPGFNKTGPQGQGPRTGEKRGKCSSAQNNQLSGRGDQGGGRGKGDGRGLGLGRRNGQGRKAE